ncbi:hypothetical protein BHE74_00032612 [Ensete ventricosum]|nr:hypothetical protein BHE74_00032612 [Ensete ventricosum]
MAPRSTALPFQRPLSFPIRPPHFTEFPLVFGVSSVGRPRRRPAQTLTLTSPRTRSGTAARASTPQQQVEEEEEVRAGEDGAGWGKVSAVLFDMDGVLCNSEELSRLAGVDVFAEMGVPVTTDDFVPFMGTGALLPLSPYGVGEANFLGGVASVKGINDFDPEAAKKRFFEIYLDKVKNTMVSRVMPSPEFSNSQLFKVDFELALHIRFDVIVSADAFEKLKPAPDIFLAASKRLNVPQSEVDYVFYYMKFPFPRSMIEFSDCKFFQCIVIEDALAGVQAAKAAQMRCSLDL